MSGICLDIGLTYEKSGIEGLPLSSETHISKINTGNSKIILKLENDQIFSEVTIKAITKKYNSDIIEIFYKTKFYKIEKSKKTNTLCPTNEGVLLLSLKNAVNPTHFFCHNKRLKLSITPRFTKHPTKL